MGLARDRAVGHGAGGEALDDLLGGLDLLDRNGRATVLLGGANLEETADREIALRLLVDDLGEGAIAVEGVAAHRVLERRDGVGRPRMRLAAQAEEILAADLERMAQDRHVGVGVVVAACGLLGDLVEADALDGGRGAEEILVDEAPCEPDRVEDLRAAIGLIGGDAHLGHHLEDALVDRLDVALDHFLVVELFGELVLHRDQRLEREIGIDRLGAVAGEAAEMMHLARLAGLDHQADRGAQALADQVMVHGRGREQRRDRDAVGPGLAVRQDDDVVAAVDGGLGALAQAFERVLHAVRALLGRIGDVERLGVELLLDVADRADLLQVLVGEDRLAHLEPLAARQAFEDRTGSAAAR